MGCVSAGAQGGLTAAGLNAVVADTMVVSALINESHRPHAAERYLKVIEG